MASAQVGTIEYGENTVLVNRAVAAPNGDGTFIAGEIVRSSPFYGLVDNNGSAGDLRALNVNQQMRVKKTTAAITDGAYLTLVANPTGTKNDYWFRAAAAGEYIHAVALEAAGLNTTNVLVYGPFLPPFQMYGGEAALGDLVAVTDDLVTLAGHVTALSALAGDATALGALADDATALGALVDAVDGAAAGQVLVADGSDGFDLTAYAIPSVDGTTGQILKTNGAGAVSWGADS